MLVGHSEYVTADREPEAILAGKLAAIESGHAPAELLYVEHIGDGEWEVVHAERPLGPRQSFGENGRRYGTGGSKGQ